MSCLHQRLREATKSLVPKLDRLWKHADERKGEDESAKSVNECEILRFKGIFQVPVKIEAFLLARP